MLKVAIATSSIEKIHGILDGFSSYFHESEIIFYSEKVDSGVPNQPFGIETFTGAKNRVSFILDKFDADYYVSSEAGIESFGELYFNVQVVCIFDTRFKKYLFGKSPGWAIPAKDISLIKEVGLDKYLRNEKNINDITELLGKANSRQNQVKEATYVALCSSKLT